MFAAIAKAWNQVANRGVGNEPVNTTSDQELLNRINAGQYITAETDHGSQTETNALTFVLTELFS